MLLGCICDGVSIARVGVSQPKHIPTVCLFVYVIVKENLTRTERERERERESECVRESVLLWHVASYELEQWCSSVCVCVCVCVYLLHLEECRSSEETVAACLVLHTHPLQLKIHSRETHTPSHTLREKSYSIDNTHIDKHKHPLTHTPQNCTHTHCTYTQ